MTVIAPTPSTTDFVNEPLLELRRAEVRDELLAALGDLDRRLPLQVPVIAGERRTTNETFASTDPGCPTRVVATAHAATPRDVEDAVAAAGRAFRTWSATPAPQRAAVLHRAAARLHDDRHQLAALAVRECAKPWREADADVAEAIDFLRYYAVRALALEEGPQLVTVPGERNELRYVPRGVTAVVAPWNFPLAIPLGMTAAALAVGSTVVLKPAEQAPACALAIVEALYASGLPTGALGLLPGFDEPGRALVRHPAVQTIAFTGSEAVGLDILRAAADVAPGQRHLKRVIAEMGGKNCIIVDADADLDEAVPAIVRSAFAFGGQKCSAASRVLVHERIADLLVERLAGAVDALRVGQAEDFATDVPPLIDEGSQRRLHDAVALARREGSVVASSAAPQGTGWFVAPTVVRALPADSELLRRELFGPLLTVEAVAGIDEACDIVDASSSALTGGLFSRDPRTVAHVARRSPVGNLYVNRDITGAMVGRHPFGGNRLSGTGTKAGGPDYLLHFVEPRVVVENTMRHGLVV
ncbi:aldehyde dehydrogenase family protein [Paraconexibacter sp.]|uniref:aldehyde dehydrogenase family protein n=1 Tax=Paraconexibacter sp. TaxID=2949640 RepID=UPI00356B210C